LNKKCSRNQKGRIVEKIKKCLVPKEKPFPKVPHIPYEQGGSRKWRAIERKKALEEKKT
jgi:hypothetical protein